jgi:L-lactate permease
MEIPSQMKELDGEIQQLHTYSNLLEDKRTSDALDMLALMGSIFLVPSFLISFYGANVLPELDDETIILPLMGICALAAGVSYSIYWAKARQKPKLVGGLLVILLGILFFATVCMPKISCFKKEEKPDKTVQMNSTQYDIFLYQDSLLLHHLKHDTTNVRIKK